MRNNSPRWNICENDESKIECKGKQIKSKLQSMCKVCIKKAKFITSMAPFSKDKRFKSMSIINKSLSLFV